MVSSLLPYIVYVTTCVFRFSRSFRRKFKNTSNETRRKSYFTLLFHVETGLNIIFKVASTMLILYYKHIVR